MASVECFSFVFRTDLYLGTLKILPGQSFHPLPSIDVTEQLRDGGQIERIFIEHK